MTVEEAITYALSDEEGLAPSFPTPEQLSGEQPAAHIGRAEEVAALAARGLANRQIVSQLHLYECTVDTHVRKTLKKLRLRSRAQIAARAGLIVDATEARDSTEPGMNALDE